MDISDKNKFFCLDISQGEQLSFEKIFGNKRPVTLEIGSGKGEFLALYSRVHPERNFIGIELKAKRIITTLKKLDIERNSNVRLLNLYVDENVTKVIPEDSISEIIIYHPDPWPKTRHHKKRIFQHSFLCSVNQILKAGGFIRISTDSLDYANWIKNLFAKRLEYVSMCAEGFTNIPPEDHLTTYFDELQSAEGFEPLFMLYRKA